MPRPNQVSAPRPARWPLTAARVLLGVAFVVDAYLAWVSVTQGSVVGCGPDSNCHTVLSSRFAYWLGLPVSVPALLVYAAVFCASLWLDEKTPAVQQRRAWAVLIPCLVAILGAAIWFVSLQAFVLQRICPFCMTAHVCASLSAALLLSRVPIRPRPVKGRDAEREVFVPPQRAAALGAAGLIALAILIGGQSLNAPKMYASSPIPGAPEKGSAKPAAREFEIFNGRYKFDLNQVPVIGRREGRDVAVSLFDYTCHICREMHAHLLEASHRFSNELTIINLPMPLDGKCNPVIKRVMPDHTNACAMARIGLTVWQVDPKAGAQFDEWVFTPPRPPSPAETEAFARQLIGTNVFSRAATNGWVEQQLSQDMAVFETVYRTTGRGAMPVLIMGTNAYSGTLSRDQVFGLLAKEYGLK